MGLKNQSILSIIIILLMIGNLCYSQYQGSSMLITPSNATVISGTASGEKYIQIKGHSLEKILMSVNDQNIYEVHSDSISKMKFNFEYKGDLNNRKVMLEDLNAALNSLGIEIIQEREYADEYTLSYNSNEQCAVDKEFVINEFNRIWEGKCVRVSQVAKQIEKWYDIKVTFEVDATIPEITLHLDDLDTFSKYLKLKNLTMTTKLSPFKKFVYK